MMHVKVKYVWFLGVFLCLIFFSLNVRADEPFGIGPVKDIYASHCLALEFVATAQPIPSDRLSDIAYNIGVDVKFLEVNINGVVRTGGEILAVAGKATAKNPDDLAVNLFIKNPNWPDSASKWMRCPITRSTGLFKCSGKMSDFWTGSDYYFVIKDGAGNVLAEEMLAMNVKGINIEGPIYLEW